MREESQGRGGKDGLDRGGKNGWVAGRIQKGIGSPKAPKWEGERGQPWGEEMKSSGITQQETGTVDLSL